MIQTLKNYYHLGQAVFANVISGFPSRRLRVIGVTGTDGKTTTTSLIYHILISSGKKASMVSSVYAKIGGVEYDTGFHVTSPSAADVQSYLKKSADNGDEFFVLETTSHGLDQYRVWGIAYEVGVLTNVTREHLDYHKTYESYAEVKSRLLRAAKIAITNSDDASYELLRKLVPGKIKTYALKIKADYNNPIDKIINATLPDFNIYNYLAAYAVCRELGLADEDIFSAMKTFKLPSGRIEVLLTKPLTAIVDFAHTPNSIEKILPFVKKEYVKDGGRLIHVFGSAGRRDESKRPIMGEASGKSADMVIITEEDYRDENPETICKEIAEGLEKHGFTNVAPTSFGSETKKFTVIINREDAVMKSVEISRPGDVIIYTGKGHEKSLCRGAKEYPWDEQRAVKKALSAKYNL